MGKEHIFCTNKGIRNAISAWLHQPNATERPFSSISPRYVLVDLWIMVRIPIWTNHTHSADSCLILEFRHATFHCVKKVILQEGNSDHGPHLVTRLRISLTILPGSVVGIATGYRAGRSWDRIPVDARFSTPVQTGLGAHPISCTGSFPG